MLKIYSALFIYLSLFGCSLAQSSESIQWWEPATSEFAVIEGQGWYSQTEAPYDRLPAKAKATVREEVWKLSKNATGLMIRFHTNAPQIVVRYTVTGSHAMNHMPATGVTGVDLYAISDDGQWQWSRANRQFSDTIIYDYQGLKPDQDYPRKGAEFRLYLPLYNQVEWLEIGVSGNSDFRPLPTRSQQPIVVYGTSIAHGACASRPGMSWANILSRKLDHPLINLGFSGNGRLEPEVVSLLTELDAKLYVIDCLPNLTNAELYPEEELRKRITGTIDQLIAKKPQIPILLVEHAGYTDDLLQPSRKQAYSRVNQIQEQVYKEYQTKGVKQLYYLSKANIGLELDDMVDGTHPNDLGMMHYATAYEKAIKGIFD